MTPLQSLLLFLIFIQIYTPLLNASSLFFHKIDSVIPQMTGQNRELCEEPFNIENLFNVVKRMPNNKSPGPDG